MVYALDTNCLARWIIRDNTKQADIVDEILAQHKVHVADMTITELVWVLQGFYRLDLESIADIVDKIISHPSINCNRALFRHVVEELPKSPKVSFIDLCLSYYVKLSDAEKLITFDKTLAKRLPSLVQLG